LLFEPAPIKRIAEYSFFESSPHVVRSGPTTDAELKRLAAAVAADETIMVARQSAAWARKPAGRVRQVSLERMTPTCKARNRPALAFW